MDSIYFEITDGSVKVGITVTEQADGSLLFDLTVLEDTGVIGDLNGIFFDLADDSIAGSLTVSGADLTGDKIDANSVTKVDSYNNVNGEVVKEDGRFDIGVQFGTQGIAQDDIQSTSFTLSTSDGSTLSIADVLNQDFAVRLTSVGEIDGSRDGSVKISGSSDVEVVSGNVAIDNSMLVTNEEDFGLFPDIMDDFQFTLLENDTAEDGTPYVGIVTEVNGIALEAGMIYTGSNGGQLIVDADGSVDFSANGEFDHLAADATGHTQFTYTIEGGSTAVLDVTIIAFDSSGGGDDFL